MRTTVKIANGRKANSKNFFADLFDGIGTPLFVFKKNHPEASCPASG
jgi:hypothetical protein